MYREQAGLYQDPDAQIPDDFSLALTQLGIENLHHRDLFVLTEGSIDVLRDIKANDLVDKGMSPVAARQILEKKSAEAHQEKVLQHASVGLMRRQMMKPKCSPSAQLACRSHRM